MCLLSFSLSPGADADGFLGNQCWHNARYLISFLPWLISLHWDRFNMWILVKIGSVVNVSSPLRILMLPKSLIDGIMDCQTMLFEVIGPFGFTAPSTEDICSSLWANNGKIRNKYIEFSTLTVGRL